MARTDRPSATIRPASSSCWSRSFEAQQGARVAGRQHAGRDPSLHRDRQVQQADRVRHLRTAAPDALRQLVVRGPELLQQLLVRRGLLERVQLRPVDVLEQRVPQHGVVGGRPHDGRDGLQAGRGRGPQAAFAHDQLVPAGRIRPDNDGLQHTEFADRMRQLTQRVLVEHLAWLLGVGVDLRDGEVGQGGPRYGQRRRCLVDVLLDLVLVPPPGGPCASARRPGPTGRRRADPCPAPRRVPGARSGSGPRGPGRGHHVAACCS